MKKKENPNTMVRGKLHRETIGQPVDLGSLEVVLTCPVNMGDHV